MDEKNSIKHCVKNLRDSILRINQPLITCRVFDQARQGSIQFLHMKKVNVGSTDFLERAIYGTFSVLFHKKMF